MNVVGDPGTGTLIVQTKSNEPKRTWSPGAAVELSAGDSIVSRVATDTSHVAILVMPPGDYSILVRAIGYNRSTGRVRVRAGYSDTVVAALNPSNLCLSQDRLELMRRTVDG
jgi:hypothetical protein